MVAIELPNIPTTILTGFLGAGKTTYLNKILQDGIPADSLVLVNDFGEINIDAELINYKDDHIIRLNNGCICCTLGGSMAERLAEISRMSPAPSALYIEVSGVANSLKVADAIRVSTRFSLADVWCFINVSMAEQHSKDVRVNVVWEQQIKSATQLSLNRLASEQDVPNVLQKLLQQSSAKKHYDFSLAKNHSLNSKLIGKNNSQAKQLISPNHGWHSFSFVRQGQIDAEWLKKLIVQYSDALYRAKGIVISAPSKKTMVLQYTGGQLNIIPAAKSMQKTKLVFIGEANGMINLERELRS